MGLKKLVVDALALGPTSRGFTGGEARRWVRESYRHRTRDYGFSKKDTRWALRHGFLPEQAARLGITAENVDDYISAKDYAFLRPLNGTYSKWITDKVTMHTIFKPFRGYMPTLYYQISKRYDETVLIPLYDDNAGDTFEDLFALLQEKGSLTVSSANGGYASTLEYRDGVFYLEGRERPKERIQEILSDYRVTLVVKEQVELSEDTNYGVLNLIVFNEFGDNPVIGDGYFVFDEYEKTSLKVLAMKHSDSLEEADVEDDIYRFVKAEPCDVTEGSWRGKPIPHWDEIADVMHRLCVFVPQLEFFCAEIVISTDGFKIVNLLNHPEYPTEKPFSKETSAYLKRKVEQKKKPMRKRGSESVAGCIRCICVFVRNSRAPSIRRGWCLTSLPVGFLMSGQIFGPIRRRPSEKSCGRTSMDFCLTASRNTASPRKISENTFPILNTSGCVTLTQNTGSGWRIRLRSNMSARTTTTASRLTITISSARTETTR